MACARHLGLVDLPIVCVNVDDYYGPFLEMLNRAYEDELIKLMPHEIVHFAPTAEEAIRWIEAEKEGNQKETKPTISRRSSALKRSSFMSPIMNGNYSEQSREVSFADWSRIGLIFAAGLACGVALTSARH
jgi:hypothetical protein